MLPDVGVSELRLGPNLTSHLDNLVRPEHYRFCSVAAKLDAFLVIANRMLVRLFAFL